MSLEQAIKENTEAVKALTELLLKSKVTSVVEGKKSEEKPAATQPAETTSGAKSEPAAESPSEEVKFDDIKKLFLKLVNKKGKPVAIELLTSFGAAKLSDLEADTGKHANIKKAIEEKINA